MDNITEKRLKAYFIDFVVAGLTVGVVEYFLRKKVKSEIVHTMIVPVLVPWSLECIQLKVSGQTFGYKRMGLVLESTEGLNLSNKQIAKRMIYRQTLSAFKFLTHPIEFSKDTVLPQDYSSNTTVSEID